MVRIFSEDRHERHHFNTKFGTGSFAANPLDLSASSRAPLRASEKTLTIESLIEAKSEKFGKLGLTRSDYKYSLSYPA